MKGLKSALDKVNIHFNNIPFELEIIPINLVERYFHLDDDKFNMNILNFWIEILRYLSDMTKVGLIEMKTNAFKAKCNYYSSLFRFKSGH